MKHVLSPPPVGRERLPRWRAARLRAAALAAACALGACGGGSGDSATEDPAAPVAPAATVRGAYTLEELQVSAQRAGRHQTVYVELQHPGAGRPGQSRRSVPYRFDTATRQTVCIDVGTPHNHSVEIRRSGGAGPAVATVHAGNPCQEIAFEAGDYDAVVQHGGTGAADTPVHVFASARFKQTDADSVFGRWLVQNGAGVVTATAKASARAVQPKADAAPACQFIESVALGIKVANGAPGYLSTSQAAQQIARFELRNTTQALLTSAGASSTVSVDRLMRVYACGSNLKFQAASGLYLASSCGYPMFSAHTIDEATAYTPYWDPAYRRLDLVNAQTQALLKAVPRTDGLVMDPATNRDYATQPSVGTCSGPLPDVLRTGSPLFEWDGVGLYLRGGRTPTMAVAEFAHRKLADVALEMSTGVRIAQVQHGVSRIAVGFGATFARYDVGLANLHAFAYPQDVDLTGGFTPSHQDVLVFSIDACRNCDLTGLDLSGRAFASLDVQGSTLARASFKNARILAARFDNAQISAADFSNARFDAVSFEGATITAIADGDAPTPTRFDGSVLASAGFPSNFRNATVTDAVFTHVDLSDSQWAGAKVTNTMFDTVTMNGIDLSLAQLTGSTMTRSSLQGATLDRAIVDDLVVTLAPARGASFQNASLTRLQMTFADLAGASFNGASLTASSLNYAFAVGTDFSGTTWVESSLDFAQAYSDGAQATRFDGCTVSSGSFANSLFMQSSFDKCRFQGGSFSNSIFAAASFANVTSTSDATDAQWSMASSVLSGANFAGATLGVGDLSNAIVSTQPGSQSVTIRISPYVDASTPGQSRERLYFYDVTTLPASVGARVVCPSGDLCSGGGAAAWRATNPPRDLGPENTNTWGP